MGDDAVKVAIRVRPLVAIERAQDTPSVVSYPSANQIQLAGAHTFTYDHLYTEQSTQQEVYETCAFPLVQSFFEGFNATILAYGQTGSGKTHTMGTSSAAGKSAEDFGIVPRVVHALFDMMRAKDATHTYVLHTQFIEVYQDEIFDLLCPIPRGRADRPVPQIKEGRGDKIEVDNVTKIDVKSAEDALDALERGSASRVTGSTNMNAASSRSHAIFTLQLSQKVRDNDELGVSNDEFLSSKFHFVDLAGSERLKRTGAVGDRMKEGIQINQGLLALGNVISALGDPTRKGGHVPFRDAKITRLLQDSLGGNSKTLMVANVSPAEVNKEETLNTLQYANRAKNIKNKAVINRDPMSQKLDLLRGRIKELEAELEVYRAGQIPTAEQKAQFAALGESIAAGLGHTSGGAHVGLPAISSTTGSGANAAFGSPFPGSSTYSHGHSGGHHHHSASVSHFRHSSLADLQIPTIGVDEIVVKAEEWAHTKEQLVHQEIEYKKILSKNSQLRQDLNEKNEEKLRVLSVKDAWRRKVEFLAEKFQDVKEFLVAEKEQVMKERKEKEAQEIPAKTDTVPSGSNPSTDEPQSTAAEASASPSSSQDVTASASPAQSSPALSGGMSESDANPSASPETAADASSAQAVGSSSAAVVQPSSVNATLASLESDDLDDSGESSLYSLLAPIGIPIADGSISTATASTGGFNSDISVIIEKNLLLSKFVRKFKTARAREREDQILLEKQRKKISLLKSQLRGMKQSLHREHHDHENGTLAGGEEEGVYGGGTESLDHSRDSSGAEEMEEEDEPVTQQRASGKRRKHSTEVAHAAAGTTAIDDLASPTSSIVSPSANTAGGLTTEMSPSDQEDLDYDSQAEKEAEDLESLNTLAQLKEQEHSRVKKILLDEQFNLNEEIQRKEIFLEQLSQEKQRTLTQQKFYQSYIDDLEKDRMKVAERVAELEKLMLSKPQTEQDKHGGLSSDQSKELAQSKLQLKKQSEELRLYREKLRASTEAQKRQHASDEAKIKTLSAEIEKAKRARIEVARKMEESSGKYKDWVSGYENKLKLMVKNQRKNELEMKNLNEQLSQQAIQLKRAREVNNVLKSKVRDQDSASAARLAAKQKGGSGAGSKKPVKSMPSIVMGNYNSNASDSHRLKELKTARGKRKGNSNSRDGKDGGSSITTSSTTGPQTNHLTNPHAIEKFSREFSTFLTQESYRSQLQFDLASLQLQLESARLLLDESSNALANAPSDSTTPEEFQLLETHFNANERAVQVKEEHVADLEARLVEYDKQAQLNGQGASFEERLCTRFKTVLSESPKRLMTVLARAFMDLSAATAGGSQVSGVNALNLGFVRDSASPLSSLGSTSGPTFHFDESPSATLASSASPEVISSSPSHFRRGSAIIETGSSSSRQSAGNSLSSSPIFRSHRSSLPPPGAPGSSPTRTGLGSTRKSAAALGLPNAAAIQQQHHSAASPLPPSSGPHANMSLSPLQAHLSQPNGIVLEGGPLRMDEEGEEELIHLPPAVEIDQPPFHTGADLVISPGSPNIRHVGLAGNQILGTRDQRTLHNNFTSDHPGGTNDSDEPDSAPAVISSSHVSSEHNNSGEKSTKSSSYKLDRTSSGGALSTSAATTAKPSNKLVFDRLTDPQHFTGTSKHNPSFAAQAQTSRTAASIRTGATLSQPTVNASTSGGGGALLSGGGAGVIQTGLKKPSSGLLLSSRVPDRSPSPSFHGMDGSSDAGVHALPSITAARVPFHERLNDPKSYTGAQRAKFAEGIGKQRGGSGKDVPTSKEREREEGFILGASSARTSADKSQRHSLERSDSAEAAKISSASHTSQPSVGLVLEGSILGDSHFAAERPPIHHARHRSLLGSVVATHSSNQPSDVDEDSVDAVAAAETNKENVAGRAQQQLIISPATDESTMEKAGQSNATTQGQGQSSADEQESLSKTFRFRSASTGSRTELSAPDADTDATGTDASERSSPTWHPIETVE